MPPASRMAPCSASSPTTSHTRKLAALHGADDGLEAIDPKRLKFNLRNALGEPRPYRTIRTHKSL